MHWVEHGSGVPAIVLHGAGVDHREPEACLDDALAGHPLRRIYPDLPGMGRSPAPTDIASANDVLDALLQFADEVAGPGPLLLVGHSVGAYYAQGFAARRPMLVKGLALICPLLADVRDVPPHRPVVVAPDLGDDDFRSYFVVQTPQMLERYERLVAPAADGVDAAAMERIGERWQLTEPGPVAYDAPTLIVAGRQDSTVGYAAAVDLSARYPSATLAVVDGAGHALPHEQPEMLSRLIAQWLQRIERTGTWAPSAQ